MDIDGIVIRDPESMKDHIQNYYKKLFSRSNIDDDIESIRHFTFELDDNYNVPLYPAYLLAGEIPMPKLSRIQKARLEGVLSLGQLKVTLDSKSDKSATGVCGFSAFFYKNFLKQF